MDKIKKRNGSLVKFDPSKIGNAIMKSNVRVAEEPMSEEDIQFLTQRVVKKLEKEGGTPDVEHIQDIVERTLQKAGYTRTAKAYILYRAEHAKMREMRDTLPEIFSNLTFKPASDVDMKRENANINTDTAMGTMLKFGTESAKDFFDKYIIPPHIAEADRDGDIHIHDKDFYTLTETCCQIDLLKLFKNGFSTGHGYLREPNSIRSYAALACIAIQSNQNEMHGGQAIPNFDYAMAEGVRKTYAKAFKKHLAEQVEDKENMLFAKEPNGTKSYYDAILDEIKAVYTEIPQPMIADKERGDFSEEETETLRRHGITVDGLNYRTIAHRAYNDTVDETHQAMEAVIHNLNSMHCLLPSEKVWVEYRDENGVNKVTTMTILELYKLVNDVADHHTWLKVYSVNPVAGKIEMKPVYAARRMDKDREMVTLVSKSGNKVTCTTNHKIIQLVDGKLTEVLPKDATHLVINRNVVNASTITPDKVKKAYDALGNRYDDLVMSDIVDRKYFNSGDEYVYDISVVDNENFMLADGTFVHNSRAGAQVPFSSINYGTDTSPEGQLVIKEILQATEEGLGNGETPIFPVQIFKVKEGVNYNPGDPSYDLFRRAMEVSSKRLFPNFSFMDAPFNAQYPGRHPDKPYYDEVGYMGCRTRVMGNVYDPENEITPGRGNLSFTSINLPRIALESRMFKEGRHIGADMNRFYKILDERIDLCVEQLLHRFKIQSSKHAYNYPFLMGEGVWIDSEKLNPMDTVGEVLKHGTLSVGFIGLAETLVALTGKHHGESQESWDLGYGIIKHMRERMDQMSEKYKLNFSLLATPAEGLSGTFVRIDKKKFGILPGITDREYYTNSFHVPVYYPISAFDKIKKEAPFHELTNAGHITYVEVDGDISKNIDAFEAIIRCMKESGIGYGSVNHPVDRDPICGYVGIINEVCPRCGRREGEAVPLSKLEELRTKYHNMPDITKYIE